MEEFLTFDPGHGHSPMHGSSSTKYVIDE